MNHDFERGAEARELAGGSWGTVSEEAVARLTEVRHAAPGWRKAQLPYASADAELVSDGGPLLQQAAHSARALAHWAQTGGVEQWLAAAWRLDPGTGPSDGPVSTALERRIKERMASLIAESTARREAENTRRTPTVAVCASQFSTGEAVRSVTGECAGLEFSAAVQTLNQATALVRRQRPAVLIVDPGLGIGAVREWVAEMKRRFRSVQVVIWAAALTAAGALRWCHCGARGMLRHSAGRSALRDCIQMVAAGGTYWEQALFRPVARATEAGLTAREEQVAELIEQGRSNREIGRSLGIATETVKLHVKHILAKCGGGGRHQFAVARLQHRERIAAQGREPTPLVPSAVQPVGWNADRRVLLGLATQGGSVRGRKPGS